MNIKEFTEKFSQLAEMHDEIVSMQTENESLKAQLDELKQTISKSGYKVEQTADGVFELVKDEESTQAVGDYLNPIPYEKGMECNIGSFYTDGEYIWECILTGIPEDFSDTKYFDIIAV